MTTTQEPRSAPTELPARSWLAALKRARPRLKELNIPLLASGVAFWAMLSIFPGVLALLAIYGLVADPQQTARQVGDLLGAVSPDTRQTITDQLTTLASTHQQSLGIGLVFSVAVLLWSASSGVQNLMQAITTAFEQKETRGFIKLRATALLLTLGGVLFSVVVLAAIGLVPLLDRLVGDGPLKYVLLATEAVVLFLLVSAVLAVLYRFAPANRPAGLRWATPGAIIGALIWLVGTIAFAVYVQNFSSYANTYGALAGVVIFMLWLYLSAYAVLLGALINAETERGMQGNAASEPEGVDRDVVRGPDEEREEAELRRPETVDLREPQEHGERARHRP